MTQEPQTIFTGAPDSDGGPGTADPNLPGYNADIVPIVPEVPPVVTELVAAGPETEGSRVEQFTDAAGAPQPLADTPVLLASIAIYQEPNGHISLVREHVPQAFFKIAEHAVQEAGEYLEQRVQHLFGGK